MKNFMAAIVVGIGFATAALAGSPDEPGLKGQTVKGAIGFWQGVLGHQNGWGQTVRTQSQGGPLGKLGTFLQEDPFDLIDGGGTGIAEGARLPNPANDNGGGND